MIAGIGCRSGVSAGQIESAIATALTTPAAAGRSIVGIATLSSKAKEAGITAAAAALGVPVVWVSQAALEAANERTLTRSEVSLRQKNVHSVAESAALAAAGPHSRLLGPRIIVGPVTCALAELT